MALGNLSAFRNRGSQRNGGSWDASTINAVWNKTRTVVGQDAATVRIDACDKVIERARYGDTTTNRGWEIDHIMPVAKGGSDDLSNLQALQWENNRTKSDTYPNYTCAVSGW